MIKILSFSGVDGTGKSIQASLLFRYLKRTNIKAKYLWLRWFAFMSYFLYMYARLLKRTVVVKYRGTSVKIHIWNRDPILSKLYPYTLVFDIILYFYFNVLLSKLKGVSLILLDRSLIDALIDIIWEIRSVIFLNSKILSKIIYDTIMKIFVIILITDTKELVVRLCRKREITFGNEAEFKQRCYLIFARHLNYPIINTSKMPIQDTFKGVLKLLRSKGYF